MRSAAKRAVVSRMASAVSPRPKSIIGPWLGIMAGRLARSPPFVASGQFSGPARSLNGSLALPHKHQVFAFASVDQSRYGAVAVALEDHAGSWPAGLKE